MDSTQPTNGTPPRSQRALHWRWLVVAVLLFGGLWIYSDWLLVWVGYSKVIPAKARVVESLGIERSGVRNKYRHVVRYNFSWAMLFGEKELGSDPEARRSLEEIETESNINLLLKRPLAEGTPTTVVFYRQNPGQAYRVNGELQFSDAKKIYLFVAVIALVIVIFAGRTDRQR